MSFIEYGKDQNQWEKCESTIEKFVGDFKTSSNGYKLPRIKLLSLYGLQGQEFNTNQNVAISLPICNQEFLITQVLEILFSNVKRNSVLVIILDACKDNSKSKVYEFLENFENQATISSIILLESEGDLFEATCENLVLSLTDSDYFVSTQADIIFSDSTFVDRAISAFEYFPNLIGISARAVIPDHINYRALYEYIFKKLFAVLNKLIAKFFGVVHLPVPFSSNFYFGSLENYPTNRMVFTPKQLRSVYVGDLIIRGPVVWKSSHVKSLGLLNDKKYFLGGDEKDLCRQAKLKKNLIVGYMPSNCHSEFGNGTTHNPEKRSEATLLEMRRREELQVDFGYVISSEKLQRFPIKKVEKNWRGRILTLSEERDQNA